MSGVTHIIDSYTGKPCQVNHSFPHHRSFQEPLPSANAVHPQGDPCVDHSGSLSSQIPGFPQADSMLGAVGMILCKAAPVDDTVYTDIGSSLQSTHLERQEEEGPSLDVASPTPPQLSPPKALIQASPWQLCSNIHCQSPGGHSPNCLVFHRASETFSIVRKGESFCQSQLKLPSMQIWKSSRRSCFQLALLWFQSLQRHAGSIPFTPG